MLNGVGSVFVCEIRKDYHPPSEWVVFLFLILFECKFSSVFNADGENLCYTVRTVVVIQLIFLDSGGG